MNQQVSFQVNTKSLMLMMGAFMATISATLLIAVGIVVPSIVHANSMGAKPAGDVQIANANPVYQAPAGYALVPTGPGSCGGGSAPAVEAASSPTVVPYGYKTVVPGMHYNSTITQIHSESVVSTNNQDSYNTKTINKDFNNGNDSNNNNGSGNNSNNTSDNSLNTNTDNSQVNTVVNTSTTTINTSTVTNSNNELLSHNDVDVTL